MKEKQNRKKGKFEDIEDIPPTFDQFYFFRSQKI